MVIYGGSEQAEGHLAPSRVLAELFWAAMVATRSSYEQINKFLSQPQTVLSLCGGEWWLVGASGLPRGQSSASAGASGVARERWECTEFTSN